MRFSELFTWLPDFRYAVQIALPPTLWTVWETPSLLLRPKQLSRIFFAHVWAEFGKFVDENSNGVKEQLIRPNGYGLVLDIGAGHGHTLKYLDRSRVTKYVAVEPNTGMHTKILQAATEAGFDEAKGQVIVLGCGIEEFNTITQVLGGENQVDTLISILTLCSVPGPQKVIPTMVNRLLKRGGQLLFYEHVESPRKDVRWWQRVWSPIWSSAFDGCELGRPTHLWIQEIEGWDVAESRTWGNDGELETSFFWHQAGKMVRA
jgi:SAM-dependent methyltransferase